MADKKEEIYFGPNVWLIDEMYRQFQESPESVTEGWRDFFADYKPQSLTMEGAPPPVKPVEPKQGKQDPDIEVELLRGFAARIVENMEESLHVPTATSTRIIPVKVLEENRRIINQHLSSTRGGKVSYTHIIAWTILVALKKMPALLTSYVEIDGKPHKALNKHINFGLAIDVQRKDGSRSLMVPNIKQAELMDFQLFFASYNDMIRKVKTNKISPDDFAGTGVSLTNPGTIGTVHSVPRLMSGQSAIIATGAIDYPIEYQAADPKLIANLGISKVMTMTCTYDHRVIQGAESGIFLQMIHQLLAGDENFYDDIFRTLDIPQRALKLKRDVNPIFDSTDDGRTSFDKHANVLKLIHMARVRGHLIADINPLSTGIRSHSEVDPEKYGLSIWDYDREFHTQGFAGHQRLTLREILDILRNAYFRTIGVEYMHIQDPDQKNWIQSKIEGVPRNKWLKNDDKREILMMLNSAEAFENFLHTKYIGHKRFSLEGAETLIPVLNHLLNKSVEDNVQEVVLGMSHRGRLNVLAN
ncbi:MAG: multifunctional oxoglutarate decarboxylase/oxoglutarate dehydrogenase thiamine pyrophosphate-binding subunit/dihydrolipoyllysine-residue succinyltransferase subunit, partial [Calditrichales bacterium]